MIYQVYYETRYLKKLKYCGDFNTLDLASAHINYLMKNLACGYTLKFKIIGTQASSSEHTIGHVAA